MNSNIEFSLKAVAVFLILTLFLSSHQSLHAQKVGSFDVEKMVSCAWTKVPQTTETWLKSEPANVLEEFSSPNKSIKTLMRYRMIAACKGIIPKTIPVYLQDKFEKEIKRNRPKKIEQDVNLRVYRCLQSINSNNEEKIVSGLWAYLDGDIREIITSYSAVLSEAEQKIEKSLKCQFIQADGSFIDA